MMQKLSKLKLCIENKPKKEYAIIKEFLMNNKLFEVDNFQLYKLKNFLRFIKGDFLIDPAKNFKENILDILNGKKIEKPKLANELIGFDNKKNNRELTNENLNNESKSDYICIVKKLKRNPPSMLINSTNKASNIKSKSALKNMINQENKENNIYPIYPKPLTKSEMIEKLLTKKYHEVEKVHINYNLTEKERQAIENFKELPLNLRRQKEICIACSKDNLDLINKPKDIIDLLEKNFKDEEKESICLI